MLHSLSKPDKIVVFDVDETLGYFSQLGIFWDALNTYYKLINHSIDINDHGDDNKILQQELFNTLIEIYPEFLRVNIIPILNYLKHKKEKKKCKRIMIYTNNHASKDWINHIISYFHHKIKYNLFDKIIRAFKVNGKIIEICRTSNDKQINDLFNCTKIPPNSQICFLDDVYYSNMVDDNVYYIKLKPYVYNLSFHTMIQRYITSKYGKKLIDQNDFKDFMNNYIHNYNFIYTKKNEKDYELDKIVSKKIMMHMQSFFDNKWNDGDNNITEHDIIIKNKHNNQTKKQLINMHNKTNKRH